MHSCGRHPQDVFHLIWDCPCLLTCTNPRIAGSNWLIGEAYRGLTHMACLYVRGLVPRDWTDKSEGAREQVVPMGGHIALEPSQLIYSDGAGGGLPRTPGSKSVVGLGPSSPQTLMTHCPSRRSARAASEGGAAAAPRATLAPRASRSSATPRRSTSRAYAAGQSPMIAAALETAAPPMLCPTSTSFTGEGRLRSASFSVERR